MDTINGPMVKTSKETKSTRGSTSIDVLRPQTHKALINESEKTGKSLRVTGNQIWDMFFEKREYLKKTLPAIENLGIREGILFLYDDNKKITAKVGLKKGNIYCSYCKSKECVHAFYGNSLPESPLLEPLNSK